MSTPSSTLAGDKQDGTPDFVYAVSLLAALEGYAGHGRHSALLPYLGMARSELVDFGQRRPTHYVQVEVTDVRAGLDELEQRLSALLASSPDLRQTLRIEAARGLLRRGNAGRRAEAQPGFPDRGGDK